MVLSIFLILLIAFYVAFSKLSEHGGIEKVILTQLSSATGAEISLDEFIVDFPGFVLSGIEISGKHDSYNYQARINSLYVRPSFWSLIRSKVKIDTLRINEAAIILEHIHQKIDDLQEPAQEELEESDKSHKSQLDTLPFNNLHFQAITLKVIDGEKDLNLVLSQAQISRSVITNSMPFSLSLMIEDSLSFDVDGRLRSTGIVDARALLNAKEPKVISHYIPDSIADHIPLDKNIKANLALVYSPDSGLDITSASVVMEPAINFSGKASIKSFSPLNVDAEFAFAPASPSDIALLASSYTDSLPDIEGGMIAAHGSLSFKEDRMEEISLKSVLRSTRINLSFIGEPVNVSRAEIKYDGSFVNIERLSLGLKDSFFNLKDGSYDISNESFVSGFDSSICFESLPAAVKDYIPEPLNSIAFKGRASLSGEMFYKEDFGLNANLTADNIYIEDSFTKTKASLKNVNIGFKEFGFYSGIAKVKTAKLVSSGAELNVSGTIRQDTQQNLDIMAEGSVDMAETSALMFNLAGINHGELELGGLIQLDLQASGKIFEPAFKGMIKLVDLSVIAPAAEVELKKINGIVSADNDELTIKQLSAEIFDGSVEITGKLSDFTKPNIQLAGKITGARLEEVRKLLTHNLEQMPEEIEFKGEFSTGIELNGAIEEPEVAGIAQLTDAEFYHPSVLRLVTGINGPIRFHKEGLDVDELAVSWGSSKAIVSGSVRDWGQLICSLDYRVHKLDLEDATAIFIENSEYEVSGHGAGSGSITGPVEELKVNGKISIGPGVVLASTTGGDGYKFPFESLDCDFSYKNGIFNIADALMQIFGGTVILNGEVDTNSDPLEFAFNSEINAIGVEGFMAANTRYPEVVAGQMSGSLSLQGNILGLDTVDGLATAMMVNGKYNSPPVMSKLGQLLSSPELVSGKFSSMSGEYNIMGGKVQAKDTFFRSEQGSLSFDGEIFLDTRVKGVAQIVFSSSLAGSSLRHLADRHGNIKLPVKVGGTFASPELEVPVEQMLRDAAAKKVRQKVDREIGDALIRLRGGDKTEKNDTQDDEAAEKTGLERKIRDLGNIFRR